MDAASEGAGPTEALYTSLHGVVRDTHGGPITGANVELVTAGSTARTGEDGAYRFTEVPLRDFHVVNARSAGHLPATRTVQQVAEGQSLRVDFVLQEAPTQEPWVEVLPFRGFLSCGAIVQVGHSHGSGNPDEHNDIDCGFGTDDHIWIVDVGPGLAGAVFEVFWDPATPVAEHMVLFLEGVGVDGGDDLQLAFQEGTSGLRALVTQLQAATFFHAEGGQVRVTVRPGAPDLDIVLSLHVNQEFEVFASLFYLAPPPLGYPLAGGM